MTTVLVVDDEPTIRGLVADALAEDGYAVETAGNGREALARARAHRPDLVVLDLRMPVMDGPAFVAACRGLPACAGVPVVLMSASFHNLDWCDRLGVAACLPKPFDLDELATTVHRLTA